MYIKKKERMNFIPNDIKSQIGARRFCHPIDRLKHKQFQVMLGAI